MGGIEPPRRDQYSPFSSRKLLKKQDCWKEERFYTFLDSVSQTTEDAQIRKKRSDPHGQLLNDVLTKSNTMKKNVV